MPTIDLTTLASALLALASAVVTTAIPIIVPALLKKLRLDSVNGLAERIEESANAGAGAAYSYAANHVGGLSHVAVQDAAVAEGLNHMISSVPSAMLELGITPEHASAMIKARLGQLLAADPTVSAGAPTAVPLAPRAQPEVPAAPLAPAVPPRRELHDEPTT